MIVGEDGTEASSAGQMETYLGVRGEKEVSTMLNKTVINIIVLNERNRKIHFICTWKCMFVRDRKKL